MSANELQSYCIRWLTYSLVYLKVSIFSIFYYFTIASESRLFFFYFYYILSLNDWLLFRNGLIPNQRNILIETILPYL